MPAEKIPARDIIIQVESAPSGSPATTTWLQVNQLTSATYNPSENEETADTTTFDSQGEYEQLVMQRGAVLELEGFLRRLTGEVESGQTVGQLDVAQERINFLASRKGVASLGKLRFRHPMVTSWTVWDATFSQGEQGGGTNDMTSWSATITKSGPSTSVAVSV